MKTGLPRFSRLLLTLLFFLSFCLPSLRAQVQEEPLPQVEWRIIDPGQEGKYSFDRSARFNKGIIYLNKFEAIASVEMPGDENGIVRINDKGVVSWLSKIPGIILGVGKTGDKLMLIYAPKDSDGQTVYGILMDPAQGKVLVDKLVYENKEDRNNEIIVQTTPTGVFKDIMVRTTTEKRKKSVFGVGDFIAREHTEGCKILYLDESVSVVKTVPVKIYADDRFIATLVNESGSVFVCTTSNDLLLVQQYDDAGLKNKLVTSFEFKAGSVYSPVFMADQDTLLAAISYTNKEKDRVMQVNQFDFVNKKVLTRTQLLDKAYAKSLSPIETAGIKSIDMNGGNIEALQPKKIVRLSGKWIVVSEICIVDYARQSGQLYTNGHLVVNFFDGMMNPLKELCFSKAFRSFVPYGISLGSFKGNDRLYLVTGSLNGLISYGNVFCSINTLSMSPEKFVAFKKSPMTSEIAIEPDATLWFGNSFLMSQMVTKNFFKVKSNKSVLQRVTL